MALSYSALRDAVESDLRDDPTTPTYHALAEVDYKIVQGLREIAKYKKHLVRVTYQIESRYGTASSTTASSLEDATKDQFVDGDAGKRIYNSTDKTWADVLSYTDADTLALSHDIMASGENYKIFNKGCWNNKQINIGDVEDSLWVERVEYPIGRERNFKIYGNVLEIDVASVDNSDPNNTDRVIDVYVWFAKRHKLSQLTIYTGVVDLTAGYDKGDVSMVIDALTDADVIEEDQEFTLASRPQVYTVTADSDAVASNETTVTFYPGLDADVANDIAVAFIDSTLDRQAESLLIDYVVAKSLMDEANLRLPGISLAGTASYKRYLETASFRYDRVIRQLEGLVEPKPAKVLSPY